MTIRKQEYLIYILFVCIWLTNTAVSGQKHEYNWDKVDEKALNDRQFKPKVDSDLKVAKQFNINGAPQFFINGKPVAGALPLEEFKKRVDRALKEAEALTAKGIKPARVYEQIIAKGHTRPAYQ